MYEAKSDKNICTSESCPQWHCCAHTFFSEWTAEQSPHSPSLVSASVFSFSTVLIADLCSSPLNCQIKNAQFLLIHLILCGTHCCSSQSLKPLIQFISHVSWVFAAALKNVHFFCLVSCCCLDLQAETSLKDQQHCTFHNAQSKMRSMSQGHVTRMTPLQHICQCSQTDMQILLSIEGRLIILCFHLLTLAQHRFLPSRSAPWCQVIWSWLRCDSCWYGQTDKWKDQAITMRNEEFLSLIMWQFNRCAMTLTFASLWNPWCKLILLTSSVVGLQISWAVVKQWTTKKDKGSRVWSNRVKWRGASAYSERESPSFKLSCSADKVWGSEWEGLAVLLASVIDQRMNWRVKVSDRVWVPMNSKYNESQSIWDSLQLGQWCWICAEEAIVAAVNVFQVVGWFQERPIVGETISQQRYTRQKKGVEGGEGHIEDEAGTEDILCATNSIMARQTYLALIVPPGVWRVNLGRGV